DRGDVDELAGGPVGGAVEQVERELRLVLAVRVDLVRQQAGGLCDLGDGTERRLLRDLERRGHRGRQRRSFHEGMPNISRWRMQSSLRAREKPRRSPTARTTRSAS